MIEDEIKEVNMCISEEVQKILEKFQVEDVKHMRLILLMQLFEFGHVIVKSFPDKNDKKEAGDEILQELKTHFNEITEEEDNEWRRKRPVHSNKRKNSRP